MTPPRQLLAKRRLKAGITEEAKVNLLGNGQLNTFPRLSSKQWELRCWVFNKRLPQIREVIPTWFVEGRGRMN
jgi:hypothetical protein